MTIDPNLINLLDELFHIFGVGGYLKIEYDGDKRDVLVRYHRGRCTRLDNGVTMFEDDDNVKRIIRKVGDYLDDNFDYQSSILSVEDGIVSVLVSVKGPFTSSNRCSFIVYSPDGSFDRFINNRNKEFIERFVVDKYICDYYRDDLLGQDCFYVSPLVCSKVDIPDVIFDGSFFGEMGDIVRDFISFTSDFNKIGIKFRRGWLPIVFFNWKIFLSGFDRGIDDKPKFVGSNNDTVFADSEVDKLVIRLDQFLKSNSGFSMLSLYKIGDIADGVLVGNMNKSFDRISFADEEFFSSYRCSLSYWYPKSQIIYDDGNRRVYRKCLCRTSNVFVVIR